MRELNQIYGRRCRQPNQYFVDAYEIEHRSKEIDDYLFSFDTDNIENFTNQINEITDYEELKRLKKTSMRLKIYIMLLVFQTMLGFIS